MTISASTLLRVVVLLTSVALALVLLLSGPVAAGATNESTSGAVTAHVEQEVRIGDTLWGIATAYTEPTADVRDTIHDIKVANDLASSEIIVGQILVIPLEF